MKSWADIAKKETLIKKEVEILTEKETPMGYDENMKEDELRNFDDEFDVYWSSVVSDIKFDFMERIEEISNYEKLPFLNYSFYNQKNYYHTFYSYMKKHSVEAIELRNRICEYNEIITGNIHEDDYEGKWQDA
jgi:hypothetical protein